MSCELCQSVGGMLLWSGKIARVVLVDDPDHPGFCRVILQDHVAEMTDLAPADRAAIMDVVWAAETAVRDIIRPDKVNLASFGNMVPHVHWHVIPRFRDDAQFPGSVWSARLRPSTRSLQPDIPGRLRSALAAALHGHVE